MENISKQTEYACSGCGACTAACPKGAIRLQIDNAGFYTAKVDDSLCVNCGLCLRLCHRFSDAVSGTDIRHVPLYAVQSADPETVKRCSSGGLAHELALAALRSGGSVIGAVYDLKTDRVCHEIVNNPEALSRLDGSKYLQSNPQEAFAEAIKRARQDPNAHFTVFGTPCQIAGLDKLCEHYEIRSQFLLVEIFCHGVPSYLLWEEQVKRMRKKLRTERFDSVQFRHKKDDWHSYCLRAEANGKTFYGAREKELFWQVFFENVLLGDACMTCRLRKEISCADLRIGDYWGRRYQGRSDGVSAAFACTKQGKNALEALLVVGRLSALEPGAPEEMLKAQNMDGYHLQRLHQDTFARLRQGSSIVSVVRYYRRRLPLRAKAKLALLSLSSLAPQKVRMTAKSVLRHQKAAKS